MELSERQKQIINVSMQLIADKGIQSLTIKNISKNVGISEPAIYRHFDSKTEILLSILEMFIENNKKIFTDKIAENESIETVINILFDNFIKTFSEYPTLISIVFSEEIFRNDVVFKEKTKAIIENNYNIITGIIKNLQQKGQISKDFDPKSLTTVILGSLRLCIKRWQMFNYDFDLKTEGNKLKNTIVQLLVN
jgi:AcrR family transcriptional regulator